MNLPMSFITLELAFETPHEAATFFRSNDINTYVVPAGKKDAVGVRDEEKVWDCKAAWGSIGEALRRTVKVDIKGQL